MPELALADFEALGLYDAADPHASRRLELLEYLVSLGATAEDLVAYRDQLPGLATVVAIRGGRPLTLAEVSQRSGVPEEKLLAVVRAAGFPEPEPDSRLISEQFADLAAGLAAAEDVFGEDAVLQLVRVMGSGMARLADAIVSAFLVNVEPGAAEEDPVGLEVARANARASALMPAVGGALEVLLRQHVLAARRASLGAAVGSGYLTQRMCVGFVDLVGSTALAQRMSTAELGSMLSEFERISADVVTSAGGRVVKLIGDEVLYTVGDEAAACSIAIRLVARFAEHRTIPQVRAGIAGGDVLVRDGDVFGPVVNLAARAVKVAAPAEVVATSAIASAAGVQSEPLGEQRLTGFDGRIELCRVLGPRPGSSSG